MAEENKSQRFGLRASARELTRLGHPISHVGLLKAAEDGRIKRFEDGTFDIDSCIIALSQNSHPARSRAARAQQAHPAPEAFAAEQVLPASEALPAPSPAPASLLEAVPSIPVESIESSFLPIEGSIADANRRYEYARAQREEIRLARERGSLVEIAPVNAFVAGMIIRVRDELTQISSELRDKLAHETNPLKIDEILSGRIESVLAKMSEYRGGLEQRVAA